MKYDDRWGPVASDFCMEYGLDVKSSILQINCEKGYLLRQFLNIYGNMKVVGVESSSYARRHASQPLLPSLSFDKEQFDLCIALGVVYTLNLGGAIQCLREIDRISFRSFITLAAYETEEDLRLFRAWTLLGTTILKKEEWIEVMKHAGYSSDYSFVTAETLRLREG
jgi:hypothetical protein